MENRRSTLKDAAQSIANLKRRDDIWQDMNGVAFMNFAAHSAMPRAVIDAARLSAGAKAQPIHADPARFFDASENARKAIARLVGASPDDIALTTGAGGGMNIVAQGLSWREGDEILIGKGDFPAHAAAWMSVAQREGLRIREVDAGNAAAVTEAITSATRLVSLSHVDFRTGAVLDTATISAACRAADALLLLDVSQSCGAMPVDVVALGADFAVGIGYKYLLGPWGVGFVWISPRLAPLRPAPWSWLSQGVSDFRELRYADPSPAQNARRWDVSEMAGPYNINLAAFAAGLEVVEGLGPERVLAHASALTSAICRELPESIVIQTPLEPSRRGAFVSFAATNRDDTHALFEALIAARVIVSLRVGSIRVAPHMINDAADAGRLLDVVHHHARKFDRSVRS